MHQGPTLYTVVASYKLMRYSSWLVLDANSECMLTVAERALGA